jgi:uncharacterized membrane protein HdeD (DUF308 family)
MKNPILLILAGILLIIVGYILEIQNLDLGDFLEGLGTGILIVGIFQLIYYFVKSNQAQKS